MLMLCATLLAGCGGDASPEPASPEEAANDGTLPLSSDVMVIDGKEYTLPVAVSELIADGWTIAEDKLSQEYEAGALKEEGGGTAIKKSDSDKFFIRGVKNPDPDAAKPLSECEITAVQFSFSVAADTTLTLPGGVTEKSTYDEVLEAYGDPETTTLFESGRKPENSLAYDKQAESGYSYYFSFENGAPSSFVVTGTTE